MLATQEVAVTGRYDQNFAQHLANDHLDVLVVDLHTLQAINVLDLTNQVTRQRFDALQSQDIVRRRLTISNDFAAYHLLAFKHVQMTPLRNQILVALARLVGQHQTAFALGFLTKTNRAGVFSHNRRFFGLSGLEQIRDSWQATRDVTRLRRCLRNSRNDVTHSNFGTIAHTDDGTCRKCVNRRNFRIGKTQFLAVFTDQLGHWTQVLGRAHTLFRIEHNDAGQACKFINLLIDRNAVNEVFEFQTTGNLGYNRVSMWIPGRDDLSRLHCSAVLRGNGRAVRHLIPLSLTTMLVEH